MVNDVPFVAFEAEQMRSDKRDKVQIFARLKLKANYKTAKELLDGVALSICRA